MMKFLSRSTIKGTDFIALGVSILFLLGFIVHERAGRWEGMLFPVVTRATITSIQPAGEFSSDIDGTTYKVRPCRWIETQVWSANPESSILLALSRPKGVTDFGTGFNAWSTMRIPLPVSLTTSVSAVTFHRCHALWLTETRLFGPETPRTQGSDPARLHSPVLRRLATLHGITYRLWLRLSLQTERT